MLNSHKFSAFLNLVFGNWWFFANGGNYLRSNSRYYQVLSKFRSLDIRNSATLLEESRKIASFFQGQYYNIFPSSFLKQLQEHGSKNTKLRILMALNDETDVKDLAKLSYVSGVSRGKRYWRARKKLINLDLLKASGSTFSQIQYTITRKGILIQKLVCKLYSAYKDFQKSPKRALKKQGALKGKRTVRREWVSIWLED